MLIFGIYFKKTYTTGKIVVPVTRPIDHALAVMECDGQCHGALQPPAAIAAVASTMARRHFGLEPTCLVDRQPLTVTLMYQKHGLALHCLRIKNWTI
jgi:hypothetical protein